MSQIGNAANSKLNGEWAKRVRKRFKMKRFTAKRRRAIDKKIVKNSI